MSKPRLTFVFGTSEAWTCKFKSSQAQRNNIRGTQCSSLRSALGDSCQGLTWLWVYRGKELIAVKDLELALAAFAKEHWSDYEKEGYSIDADMAAYKACCEIEGSGDYILDKRNDRTEALLRKALIPHLNLGDKHEPASKARPNRPKGRNGKPVQTASKSTAKGANRRRRQAKRGGEDRL